MELDSAIKELTEDIKAKRETYNQRKGQKEQLESELETKYNSLEDCREKKELLEQVTIFLQEVSQYARRQAKEQIERLVSHALQAVFGEKFSFQIEIEKKRNSFSAQFYVVSEHGNQEIKNIPQDSRGGGVVDVVSLGLRVAILETLQRPKIGGPLVLDEPAKHVSEEYLLNVTKFLKMINNRFERQIIIVTHQESLTETADKGFQLSLKEGKSRVSDLTVGN